MAYSEDYRHMILSKLEEGDSFRELAAEYQLSPATIQRWKKNSKRKQRVFLPLKIDNQKLIEDVATYPDSYHHERAIRLSYSPRGIGMALKSLGISQKKDT